MSTQLFLFISSTAIIAKPAPWKYNNLSCFKCCCFLQHSRVYLQGICWYPLLLSLLFCHKSPVMCTVPVFNYQLITPGLLFDKSEPSIVASNFRHLLCVSSVLIVVFFTFIVGENPHSFYNCLAVVTLLLLLTWAWHNMTRAFSTQKRKQCR